MIQVKTINWFGRKDVYKDWISTEYFTNKLYYIHSGNCFYEENGKKIMFEHGYLYLIPFTISFHPYSEESTPLDHSYADFELIPPLPTREIYKLKPDTSPLIKAAFDLFLTIVGNNRNTEFLPDDYDADSLSLLTAAVTFLIKQYVDMYSINVTEDKLSISIMNELVENIDKDISINDLAKKYYMSPDAIIRRFKRNFNTTPHAYLKELRLRTATYLIQSGEKLSNVARATNYSDASSLLHALNKKKPS